ncbi:alkaline phosphatase PhoX [Kocuria sp. CPCC 204721]|uniref:alkaline phosphatase PhoX n=1 Tax=Kocuria sp. CPCC 204721 TaxID=3073548 RepID=UPI0034D62B96
MAPGPGAAGPATGAAAGQVADYALEVVMAIVDNGIYVNGHRVQDPAELGHTVQQMREHSGMAWLGLYRPSEQELQAVAGELGLHALAVEDTLKGHQRAKLDHYGDHSLLVLRPARYLDDVEKVEFGELHVYIGEDFVVTVRHAESPDLAKVRHRMEQEEPELLSLGPRAVLYAVVDQVVDEYEPVVDGLSNDIDEIDDQLFSGNPNVSRRIYELSREVIELQRATLPLERQRRNIFRNAVGLSVVELRRKKNAGPWDYVCGAHKNRRITLDTEFELTGPAAGSELLKTKRDRRARFVEGTLGNCSGGTTPWGTILSGEENFNGFFRTPGTSVEDKRYGLENKATGMGWELEDPRFDARGKDFANEPHRFGYIVEIDPEDPRSTPVKHTSLGRFKHEGANVIVADSGHVVAYMGDDERFDYLYKFVSKRKYRKNDRRHNMTLLTEGDLYVARFSGTSENEIDGSGDLPSDGKFDGSGQWLPLVEDGKSRVKGMGIEQVLVFTRLAADAVGATKMDRCEDVEPSLKSGKVYIACTNNSNRGVGANAQADEANPRTENRDGHIVEITERRGDHTATRFNWDLLMLCGDPAQGDATYFSGFPADQVSPISCPDNVAFDSEGNLWISTDGAPDGIGYNDGLFKVTVDGKNRGKVEQFLSVPRDAETCGPVIHDDDSMVYVAVQHPGEEGSYSEIHSYFPDYVPSEARPAPGEASAPRPSIVQVYRPSAQAGTGR